jgi:predicted kinase
LNVDQLERRLGRELSASLGVEGIQVRCPEPIDVARGAVVRCTARVRDDDRTLRVAVTQIDDEGHVTWELVDPEG